MTAVVAALGGAIAGAGLTWIWLRRTTRSSPPAAAPFDLTHLLELLARVHSARGAWAVGLTGGDVEALAPEADPLPRADRDRGAALAQLASADGRSHVARDPAGIYVAVGDFPFGVAFLLQPDRTFPQVAEATAELRRFVATIQLTDAQQATAPLAAQLIAKRLALGTAGVQTLEGIARAGAQLAEQVASCGAAIVVPGANGSDPEVVAASRSTDPRLGGARLAPHSPVARALQSGLPVVTTKEEDIFGPGMPERRRRERAGTAYPLIDGHAVVGALVLLGPTVDADSATADQIARLIAELGPRLAAARAVHEAEQRAVRDPLTGLKNRREFERWFVQTAGAPEQGPSTLIYIDLDHFKRLNDTLGHAAGDAALKHVAAIFTGQVRDRDLVARIGGEEFAVWLPGAPLAEGLEVAERIRRTVEQTAWQWDGTRYPITASCGVASFPVPVPQLENLRAIADAALYHAKQAGRNRVEKGGVPN